MGLPGRAQSQQLLHLVTGQGGRLQWPRQQQDQSDHQPVQKRGHWLTPSLSSSTWGEARHISPLALLTATWML